MTQSLATIVLATTNAGKLAEFRQLLADLPVQLVSVRQVLGEQGLAVVEDGETFAQNAYKKARAISEATLMMTLADDSGLEVDALDGAPGVRSARYAGERATDAQNNAALLRALQAVAPDKRTARFRCALCLIDPWAEGATVLQADGTCEGLIAQSPSGSGGFGYDPLFIVAGDSRTMAEHTDEEKNQLSHRARAVQALKPSLARVLQQRFEVTERVLAPRT